MDGAIGFTARVPLLGGVLLGLDPVGAVFLLLTATLWLACGAFAWRYHRTDPHRRGFATWFLLVMTGNLGLAIAHDALAFYLFFALMTFAAWGLVVHERTAEAYRAGRIYIVLAVLGDVAILVGLFNLSAAASVAPAFGPEMEGAWRTLAGGGGRPGPTATAALLLAGFGVKAGLIPLHVWLPLAHPVAPTAASALLSGAMIKGGLLGWIRFLPAETAFPGLAAVVLVLGVVAAIYGVVVGLLQDEAKTALAYSSVSQMGFMTLAIGLMIRAPELAAPAAAAAALYALHHGLAKGALFLSVGVVDRAPGWSRWRGRSAVLAATLLPALAVAGAPLTSGARAKGTLEAALEQLGGTWYVLLEPLLLAATAGTTLLLARFLLLLDRRGMSAASAASTGSGTEPHTHAPGDATRGGGSAAPPPSGLLVPWGMLVGASASAVLWLPFASPEVEAGVPSVLASPWKAGLPVLLGALVAWLAYRRPELTRPLLRLRVPPGDAVVPVEAALRRLPSLRTGLPDAVAGALRRRGRALASRGGRLLQALADRDLLLMRGAVVGTSLLILVGALILGAL